MRKQLVCAPLLAGALLAVTSRASAAQLCSNDATNPLPNPVFVTGSSALGAVLPKLGAALAGTTTIVSITPGSCQGVDAIFNGTPVGTGTATYWDNTGTANTCTLANEVADVGVSDVYYKSCPAPYAFTTLPSGVTESLGFVIPEAFVVPAASTANVISAAAAYMVYGFGGQSGTTAAPWLDPTAIFQSGGTNGPQMVLANAIGVPTSKWLPTTGVVTGGSTGMLNSVSQATNMNAAIGIMSSDTTDATSIVGGNPVSNRTLVKILQYQHSGQECSWLPDSSATAFDKRNVRAGHYVLWGQEHFFTKGTKPQATDLVGYFTGAVAPPTGVSVLDLEIKGHFVPTCAMKVQRSAEMGPFTPYKPAQPCGCYMEELLAPGTSGCTACSGSMPCATGTCSNGYCEGG